MSRFDNLRSVHIIGIGGTAMGTFAALLKARGLEVRGSDVGVYPPMSDKLREWKIPTFEGYDAANLDWGPDLVVVGNVIRRDNPEASHVRKHNIAQASFPETLGELFLKNRHSVVVAGTHGKTTTSTLIAQLLRSADQDPSYLIGGVPQDGGDSFSLGQGPHFVVEGDEYDTVYWDKVPKFVHYRPRTAVLTSVEFDHADIYTDLAAVEQAFTRLIQLMPDDGVLVCARHLPLVDKQVAQARCRVLGYGPGQRLCAAQVHEDEQGLRFRVILDDRDLGEVQVSLSGAHGLDNALAAYAVARELGLDHKSIARGMAGFAGVRRRMELRGEIAGITVIDDFAHHPTAVRLTLEGARRRFFGRRLWALFEPRSATASRRIFADDFARSFGAADRVVIATSGRKGQLAHEDSLDEAALAAAINNERTRARHIDGVDAIVHTVAQEALPGDVLLCMSNGSFGDIHDKLLRALQDKESASS